MTTISKCFDQWTFINCTQLIKSTNWNVWNHCWPSITASSTLKACLKWLVKIFSTINGRMRKGLYFHGHIYWYTYLPFWYRVGNCMQWTGFWGPVRVLAGGIAVTAASGWTPMIPCGHGGSPFIHVPRCTVLDFLGKQICTWWDLISWPQDNEPNTLTTELAVPLANDVLELSHSFLSYTHHVCVCVCVM